MIIILGFSAPCGYLESLWDYGRGFESSFMGGYHLASVCLEDIAEELGKPLVRARSHWQGEQRHYSIQGQK